MFWRVFSAQREKSRQKTSNQLRRLWRRKTSWLFPAISWQKNSILWWILFDQLQKWERPSKIFEMRFLPTGFRFKFRENVVISIRSSSVLLKQMSIFLSNWSGKQTFVLRMVQSSKTWMFYDLQGSKVIFRIISNFLKFTFTKI